MCSTTLHRKRSLGTTRSTKGDIEKEIRRCASDFLYFCRYLKIVNKKAQLISFKPNEAQRRLIDAIKLNPWVFDLKARQLGGTTGIAAYAFWHALLRPNFRVGVLAQSREAAEAIFEIYKRFYANLPDFLKFPTTKSNVRELLFFHGGMVRVFTANTQSARGTTYNFLHCSEFSFYKDVAKTIESAFQTATPDAIVVMETTANGLNHAYDLWKGENGYSKVFLPWTVAEEYTLSKPPTDIKRNIPKKWKDYAAEHKLTKPQLWWAYHTYRTKCGSSWNTFHQEYPVTADLAFITSGERFFDIIFPHAQASAGYKRYSPPQKFRCYTMGVDTASGSPSGDYSAFCVLDVTDKKKPKCVSTFYAKLPPNEFSVRVLKELREYDALCVAESNSYGLSVIEYLVGQGYANHYRRTKFDKVVNRWREDIGFATSVSTRPVLINRLRKFIGDQSLVINDERMKFEMNTFIYNSKGKATADSGKHDDMIFAWGLALAGLEQVEALAEEKAAKKPQGIREILEYEMTTGRLYSNTWGRDDSQTLDFLSEIDETIRKYSPRHGPGVK